MQHRSALLAAIVALAVADAACIDRSHAGSPPDASARSGISSVPVFAGAQELSASPATELRVLTYNVHFAKAGDESTVAVLRDNPADLVLLQETNEVWEGVLRGAFGRVYPHAKFIGERGRNGGGSGILSTFPISAVEELRSPIGWFSAMRAVVETHDEPLEIVNVHLRPNKSDSGSWFEGLLTTGPTRRQEISAHLKRVRSDLGTIVAGDFNEGDDGHAMELLGARGFSSALEEAGSDDGTWRLSAMGVPLRVRLDDITFQHAKWVVVDARVIPGGGSDHLAVLATLRERD